MTKKKYSDSLSGRGGLMAPGRWHTRPQSIVYCSGSANTAYSEIANQLGGLFLIPNDYVIIDITIPDFIILEEIKIENLEKEWSSADGWKICRPIGDEWLKSHRSAVLKVPSAVDPDHANYTNPH